MSPTLLALLSLVAPAGDDPRTAVADRGATIPTTVDVGGEATDYGVVIERPNGAPERFERRVSEPGAWHEHVLIPGETVERVAARYGVSELHTKLANLEALEAGRWRSGKTVRIKARRTPPPRRLVRYTVRDGDDWVAIAVAHGVRYRDLRTWNWKTKTLRAGRALDIWVDPDARETLHPERAVPRPRIAIRPDAKSLARPNRGRIDNAVRLPESYLYTLKSPPTSWGSSHAIGVILDAIVALRSDFGFHGELILGSMSRRYGRRFPPHVSHQSGRDIDIFLPLLPEVPFSWKPNPWMIDWQAVWALVQAFDRTGQVEMILLDTRVQKYLYETARQSGASDAELKRLIGWPRWPNEQRQALVRHGKDHTRHMHVRIACGPLEDRCYSRWGDERYLAIQKADAQAEKAADSGH